MKDYNYIIAFDKFEKSSFSKENSSIYLTYFKYLVLSVGFLFALSCKKFVQVPAPTTSLTQTNVYSNDAAAISVLTGLYTKIASNSSFTGSQSFSILCGLSSDEMTLWSSASATPYPYYFKNNLTLTGTTYVGSEFWTPCYSYIFACNSAIEGINSSEASVSSGVKKQLLGEAKFVRAFCYFYLINLYGDVPLVLTTNYMETAKMSKTMAADVYRQIISDLVEARSLLSPSYLNAGLNGTSVERVRPTSWAAAALLARAYLYMKDYANAEAQATVVIANNNFSLSSLNNAFLRAGLGNNEAIWQLQPVGINGNTALLNTWEGYSFNVPSTGPSTNQSFFVSNSLYSSFEAGDNRKASWTATYGVGANAVNYPYKYKLGIQNSGAAASEYTMVLRLAEQYLIRAEARLQQGNVTGAITDMNVVRARAFSSGGAYSGATDNASVLAAIMHERQVELFSEWGHRWLDLKRTGTIDAVMNGPNGSSAKGGSWVTTQQLYPLPYNDLLINPNLVQNKGY